MMKRTLPILILPLIALFDASSSAGVQAADPKHPLLTWVKQHPNPKTKIPSPRMGYECAYGYDPVQKLLIRYGGHNQGGGGEQNSEVWTYDLDKDIWTLKHPNDAPPGVCCAQQNVFHDALGKYIRFPAFSASHGWQSIREVSLHNSSVWTYDLASNTWNNRRPLPEPRIRPLRGAAYDPHHQVVVIHGGEGTRHSTVVFDLYTNTWHWMKPKKAPPEGYSQPGFTYDAVNKAFVYFGSQFQNDPRTWVYDLPKNEWRVLKTAIHPPAQKSSPILAADTRNGVVLCSVRGKDGLETWALDVAKSTWKRLDVKYQPDEQYEGMSGNRNRVLLFLPDRNLFVMEVRTRKEQQIWTFRYAEAKSPLPKAKDAAVTINEKGNAALLTWKAPTPTRQYSYNIYRGVGPHSWQLNWQIVSKNHIGESYLDKKLKAGNIYWYKVHAETTEGRQCPASFLVRTQPQVVEHLYVSARSAKKIELTWKMSASKDVVGYHVERAPVQVYSTDQVVRIKNRLRPTSGLAAGHIRRIGSFQRLTTEPISNREFTDTGVDLGKGQVNAIDDPIYERDLRPDQLDAQGKPYRYAVYVYRIIAVNRLGVESGPSPARFTFPSPVQYVFSKEEGKTATQLKWKANLENGIKGYFVYRHNGRFNNAKIVRLTPAPIGQTSFTDPDAGQATRRYEIVSVDALGQEGIPSQPVWSRREWASFYVPYVEGWHQ